MKSEDIDWPLHIALGKTVYSFEEYSLKCKMCYEFYDNPQVLVCGHSFCSICLSKRFDKRINPNAVDSCPQCREKADVSTLKPNRVLADIVESYKNVRKELHALVVNDKINDNKNELHSLKTKSEIKTVILKKLPLQTFHNEPLARIKDFISNVFKSNYPNSKVSFNLNGDKATLERRYREFLHMHNSQVESPTALSLEEVIKLINQIEINKSNLAKSESASLPILEAVKDGKQIKAFDNGFKNLVKKAKLGKNQSVKRSMTANDINHLKNEYSWGSWRVIMSKVLNRPFFYNVTSKIGQFDIPAELMSLQSEIIEENVEMSCNFGQQGIASSDIDTGKAVIPSPSKHPAEDFGEKPYPSNGKFVHSESILSSEACSSSNHNTTNQYITEIMKTNIASDYSTAFESKACNPISSNDAIEQEFPADQLPANDISIDSSIWICTTCTFENQFERESCEMCDSINIQFIEKLTDSLAKNPSKAETPDYFSRFKTPISSSSIKRPSNSKNSRQNKQRKT